MLPMHVAPTVARTDDDAARQTRRAARLAAQELLWDLAGMDRLRRCGREGVLPGGSVRIRATGAGADRRAGFAGVATCGSVWACPVCSAKVLARRADELAQGVDTWAAQGGSVAMLTLTMRHHRGQSLDGLWDALTTAWRAVTSSGSWKRTSKAAGVAGYVRVVEVTHGGNGWHVHVHVGLLLDGQVDVQRRASALGNVAWSSWRPALMKAGYDAPIKDSGGLHVAHWQPGTRPLADYFTKNVYELDAQKVALELARGDLKAARAGNRTPFRILADVAAYGLVDDVELWQEWERASKGRRQMVWSNGLRDRLGLGVEATDDELAAEELGTGDDDLVELPAATWRAIGAAGLRGMVLDLAEHDETGQLLRRWLDARGLGAWIDVRKSVRT